MPTIHEVLADAQQQCQALAEEIATLKQSRVLHQEAAGSIDVTCATLNKKVVEACDAACAALNKTANAIQPFTDVRFQRITFLLAGAAVLNTFLFIAILLVVILKK